MRIKRFFPSKKLSFVSICTVPLFGVCVCVLFEIVGLIVIIFTIFNITFVCLEIIIIGSFPARLLALQKGEKNFTVKSLYFTLVWFGLVAKQTTRLGP